MSVLLYNKSCYSLLSSSISIEQLINHGLNKGFSSIGLIDDNLFGAMSFYRECVKNNIKPIIGLEIKIKIEESFYPFLIIAKNNDGYRKLMEISSKSTNEEYCLVSKDLSDLSSNCFIIIPTESYLYDLYSNDKKDEAISYVKSLPFGYFASVGAQSFYKAYNEFLNDICINTNVKQIGCNLALYADKEDYIAYQALLAIKFQTTITDNRLDYNTNGHLLNKEELKDKFNDNQLYWTDFIGENVDIKIDQYHTDLPIYKCPNNQDSQKYLRELSLAGLKKRMSDKITKEYLNRLEYELQVICQMNYQNYFLIIYDIILFSRKQGIYVGPGRGSAVGCLVAYCLGITHLDPIKYGLLFERFLNPERVSMPDIDIDFPDDRRNEVFNYVKDKYGDDHVAHIITFGTLAAKAAIRDVGKVLNINANSIDIIAKNIDANNKLTLQQIYNSNNKFKTIIDSSDENRKLFYVAKKLEGLPRHSSIHAAGVVLSNKKLTDIIPIIKVEDYYATQYSMEHLEQLGLIKIDFLSLFNLSTIARICESIGNIDILKIPLDDKNTFQLLQSGDTNGIFQLEQKWVMDVLKKFKPTKFEDIATIISLCRPGAMQFIDQYIECKNNPNLISYVNKDLKPILENTNGIIIYQEQIMQIAQKFAGFSLGKADILRRAISKKKIESMNSIKNDFISGAKNNGYSETDAETIYQLIEKFANYGFNKSHAIAYGLVAYQLTYLKANYPLAFYQSLLNSVIGANDKISSYILEMKKRNIEILPVDVNHSCDIFIIENNKIRYPLSAVKNISSISAKTILEERKLNGQYKNYFDFVARLNSRGINKKAIESLIRSSSCDCFNLTHNTMLNGYEEANRYGKLCEIETNGQISIDLDLVPEPIITNYADSDNEIMDDQFEYLGLYLKSHPIEQYRSTYQKVITSYQLNQIKGSVETLLIINRLKEIRTKNNELMCFANCNDEFGTIELAIMPKEYAKYKDNLVKGNIFYVKGFKDNRESIKVSEMLLLNR